MNTQLTGNEPFTYQGHDTGITVKDFWSWAYSDLLNNTLRGVMAEFLVFTALAATPPPEFFGVLRNRIMIRTDWTAFDLISPSGRRIEVKSAAYIQAWEQDGFSKILFDIAPKREWSPTDGYSSEIKRHSDLYVFCVYTALTREKSMLDLDLWDFYVLPTKVLDQYRPNQKTIALSSLMGLKAVKCNYGNLKETIENISLEGNDL